MVIYLIIRNYALGKAHMMYPKTRNCKDIEDMFDTKQLMEKWKKKLAHDDNYLDSHGLGMYHCYCKKMLKDQYFVHPGDQCWNYMYNHLADQTESVFISIFTIVFNMSFRKIVVKMMDLSQLSNKSTATKETLVFIFWAVYINTCFIVMLAMANFDYTILTHIFPLNNRNPDYTQNWYI